MRVRRHVFLAIAAWLLAAPGFAQNAPPPGEQPKQLAQPNGPLRLDPNQHAQPAPATGAPAAPEAPGAPIAPAVAPNVQDQTPPAEPPPNWTAALSIYAGTWTVKPEHSEHSQIHTETCQTSGSRFYECEHVVDGETIALLIIVPGDEPGHYYVQSVLPSGTALGRGDLAINGDTWVFNSKTQRENGSIDYERTTRVFSGHDKDTIHYQMERSDDGLHWTMVNSGIEKRKK